MLFALIALYEVPLGLSHAKWEIFAICHLVFRNWKIRNRLPKISSLVLTGHWLICGTFSLSSVLGFPRAIFMIFHFHEFKQIFGNSSVGLSANLTFIVCIVSIGLSLCTFATIWSLSNLNNKAMGVFQVIAVPFTLTNAIFFIRWSQFLGFIGLYEMSNQLSFIFFFMLLGLAASIFYKLKRVRNELFVEKPQKR